MTTPANVNSTSTSDRDKRFSDSNDRVKNLTTVYDEMFELLHELARESGRAETAKEFGRMADISSWRKRVLKALYALNVYAQNGLRNNVDLHVLIEIARHVQEYKTSDVKTVTQQ